MRSHILIQVSSVVVNNPKKKKPKTIVGFTKQEWEYMKEIDEICQPIIDSMLFAQASHFAITIPIIYRVLKHINQVQVKTPKGKEFAKSMSIELLRRLNAKPRSSMVTMLKAMVLDPRFKDNACSQDQLDIQYPVFKAHNITCEEVLGKLRRQFKELFDKFESETPETQQTKRIKKKSGVLDDDDESLQVETDPFEYYLKTTGHKVPFRDTEMSRSILLRFHPRHQQKAFLELCKQYWCVPATNIASESSFLCWGLYYHQNDSYYLMRIFKIIIFIRGTENFVSNKRVSWSCAWRCTKEIIFR